MNGITKIYLSAELANLFYEELEREELSYEVVDNSDNYFGGPVIYVECSERDGQRLLRALGQMEATMGFNALLKDHGVFEKNPELGKIDHTRAISAMELAVDGLSPKDAKTIDYIKFEICVPKIHKDGFDNFVQKFALPVVIGAPKSGVGEKDYLGYSFSGRASADHAITFSRYLAATEAVHGFKSLLKEKGIFEKYSDLAEIKQEHCMEQY